MIHGLYGILNIDRFYGSFLESFAARFTIGISFLCPDLSGTNGTQTSTYERLGVAYCFNRYTVDNKVVT